MSNGNEKKSPDSRSFDSDDDPRSGGFVPDLVRKAVLTGVGALFMTEEGIRNMVGEMKLPKDALAFLVAQADKTRAEVSGRVTQEIRRFLESETLRRELWKLLTSVTMEVHAEIKLKPSGEPGLKVSINTKDNPPPADEPPHEPPPPAPGPEHE